jgi:hypothetical protein
LALSAKEISTAFCAGLMPCNGQQALMMMVLTHHLATEQTEVTDLAQQQNLSQEDERCLYRVRCA